MGEISLRSRLVVAAGLVVLCSLAVVGSITYALVTRSQLQQVDDTLQRAHTPVEQIAESPDESDWRAIPAIAPGLFVAIIEPDGTEAFTTAAVEAGRREDSVDLGIIDVEARQQTVMTVNGEEIRLRVDPIAGGRTLVVGESLHDVNEASRRLLVVLALGSLAAIAAALALSWWVVRAGLRPLTRVEASAAGITDDELGDHRVPGAGHSTEVGRLAAALNAMLDRLQAARAERESTLADLRASEARMRRFVADASHELRTPIAATAAYAELFDEGARNHPDDLERAMTGIRREAARMGELVDDLLLLARLDERRPLRQERVDMTELVLTAVDAARTLEPDRPIRVTVSDVIDVVGDPMRLRQVVDNLLANVRAHTPVTAPCHVAMTADDDQVVLTVADSGPGVAEADLTGVFDRFSRLDDSRTRASGGSGLGLSIVKAIVEAHGGTIVAEHNAHHGLVVTVVVPRRGAGEASGDRRSEPPTDAARDDRGRGDDDELSTGPSEDAAPG